MRISDWSSDVCSSDLQAKGGGEDGAEHDGGHLYSNEPWGSSGPGFFAAAGFGLSGAPAGCPAPPVAVALPPRSEERRVGKAVSVRVDLGGRRIIKKKKQLHTHTETHRPTQNIN